MGEEIEYNEPNISLYGLKLKLDHIYSERRTQGFVPHYWQLWKIIPLILRYLYYYWKRYRQGRKVLMDYIHPLTGKQIYGVPIGGIGCGSIGRGYRGEFCRYQLRPGMYEYETVYANQFIVTIQNEQYETIFQSLLSTFQKPNNNILNSWCSNIDGGDCSYIGLYPRSWTEYNLTQYGIKLICRQISPIIPNNYKDSSLPCAVFVWQIENKCTEIRHVTITFTFKNGTKNLLKHESGDCTSKLISTEYSEGVSLHQEIAKMSCTYMIAAKKSDQINITNKLYFDPAGDGTDIWLELQKTGQFNSNCRLSAANDFHTEDEDCGIALACQTTVVPNRKQIVAFSLVWHIPEINFGISSILYDRYYTNYFHNVEHIVDYALVNYHLWETQIDQWQNSILNDSDLPEWYKSAIFNETYFISDGGSVWLKLKADERRKLVEHDPRLQYGRFAYLEGHEYRMYNTYDVHFYASIALAKLWPKLQLIIQYDYRDNIFIEIDIPQWILYDGQTVKRKCKDSVPHDIGDPDENPFELINAYPIHDVSQWRDLNTKFVLTVFRDTQIMQSDDIGNYLIDMYEACRTVIEKTSQWDTDGDGLIENQGTPDQTYDTWIMKGPSAYCGGLWLAALYAMVKMSQKLDRITDYERYKNLLKRGIESFDKKLWSGCYYLFDTEHSSSDTIMSDQLCGYWLLRCCGCQYDVFPEDKVKQALKTIYNNNVMKFHNGEIGAVNGYLFNANHIDYTTMQSEECWTGVTYSLASTMIYENMIEEAWKTAGGMYKYLYEKIGMGFETPEAIYERKYYRAIGYMRPLSIWSIQLALEQRKKIN